jgi:hypothetical protein
MAGDVRGRDLDSWWGNRAAFRQEAAQAANQWRAAAARFAGAAGGVKATAVDSPDETLSSLNQQGERTLEALVSAHGRFAALDRERQEARSAFAAEESAIRTEGAERVRAERQAAHQKAHHTTVQLEKSKTVVRKFGAVLVALLALYAILRF